MTIQFKDFNTLIEDYPYEYKWFLRCIEMEYYEEEYIKYIESGNVPICIKETNGKYSFSNSELESVKNKDWLLNLDVINLIFCYTHYDFEPDLFYIYCREKIKDKDFLIPNYEYNFNQFIFHKRIGVI